MGADGLSVEEALAQADWLARYAMDRIPSSERSYHPGIEGHLITASTNLRHGNPSGASVQLQAAIKLIDPAFDVKPKFKGTANL